MAQWLRCCIPNREDSGSKPLGGFKVDTAFHSPNVAPDLVVKSKLWPYSESEALRQLNPIHFGAPNETPVTLVIGTFKLSTSRQISLSESTFSQKDFTQVAQVQASPDAGAMPILRLVYQFLVHQFQAPKSRAKGQPAKTSQESQVKISSF